LHDDDAVAECHGLGLIMRHIDGCDAERAQRTVEDARGMTFDSCADAYIKAHSSAWKNEKHVAQWKATIRTYVSPVFGSLPVQAVVTAITSEGDEYAKVVAAAGPPAGPPRSRPPRPSGGQQSPRSRQSTS